MDLVTLTVQNGLQTDPHAHFLKTNMDAAPQCFEVDYEMFPPIHTH